MISGFPITNKSTSKSPPKLSALAKSDLLQGSRLGIDSHADISCVGKHARVIEVIEGEECTVHPFNDSMTPLKNVKTVNIAYTTDTPDGRTYILRVNRSLDFTASIGNSILCSNQARSNGIIVDDVSKLLDIKGTSSQSVVFSDQIINIGINVYGPVPYFPIRHPTEDEMIECQHLDITSYDFWDPSNILIGGMNSCSNELHTAKYNHDHEIFYEMDMQQRLINKLT